jgi:SAM-dependent methyltransferase
MPINKLREKISISDEEFDALFPEALREHSNRHYTSVFLSQKAATYLATTENTRILDIGSGTGKFCLVGASCTNAHFTGVEYRKNQSDIANEVAMRFDLQNVNFIHANVLDIDFNDYDAFYIFNPFLENIDRSAKMDESMNSKESNYEIFRKYVHNQLSKKPVGTRLASYFTNNNQVPDSYELIASMFGDTLRFWEKVM